MLAALYMYQVVFLQYTTITTVERAANIWDKHDRAIKNGSVRSEVEYGLYENDLLIQLTTAILPVSTTKQAATVSFTSPQTIQVEAINSSLITDKLNLLNEHLSSMPIHASGHITYSTPAILPRIEIQMKQKLSPLMLEGKQLLSSPSYYAYRSLVQPTGLIRNTDLVILYSNKLSKMSSTEQSTWKEKGGKAVESFSR